MRKIIKINFSASAMLRSFSIDVLLTGPDFQYTVTAVAKY